MNDAILMNKLYGFHNLCEKAQGIFYRYTLKADNHIGKHLAVYVFHDNAWITWTEIEFIENCYVGMNQI